MQPAPGVPNTRHISPGLTTPDDLESHDKPGVWRKEKFILVEDGVERQLLLWQNFGYKTPDEHERGEEKHGNGA